MRREDMLRHARECRQWAGTARTHEAKLEFLKAAETWELLAREPDLDLSDSRDSIFKAFNGTGPQQR
jgi:hypothetical protein